MSREEVLNKIYWRITGEYEKGLVMLSVTNKETKAQTKYDYRMEIGDDKWEQNAENFAVDMAIKHKLI